MIELRNIHKSFNGVCVLNGITLTVEKGETFVIIGSSGTGKTVTIRHIAGLVEPDSGEVLIDSVRMNGADRATRETLRKKMGVVFQSGALINWMTVVDNIRLPLVENRIFDPEEIERVVDEKLRLMQLSDARDKMPSDISGGMKKRASLARVLVRNPEIILYDEPTSGLDPVMSNRINELILKMKRDFNVTSVVVTHDMESAFRVADRIAVLYNGKIIQCDVPDAIRNSDHPVVQQFIRGDLVGPIEIQ